MKIEDYINIGDKVRYKGKLIQVYQFTKLDRKYSIKDTDQLYKNDILFAEKINGKWQLVKD